LRVLLYPAKVQGIGAREEIAAGIEYFNTLTDIDVLIVGRGGGSIEDLWAFNEEIVARAIAESRIPVISAVGHEVDFTIADFVADLRAPTPSAAAELVVLKKSEFTEKIGGLEQRLVQSFQYYLSRCRNSILILSSDRAFASVESRLQRYQQRADELAFRLENYFQNNLEVLRSRLTGVVSSLERYDLLQKILLGQDIIKSYQERLAAGQRFIFHRLKSRAESLDRALEALNPLGVLQRGYAICRDAQGRVLKSAGSLNVGDPFSVVLANGKVVGRAEQIISQATREE
jgi:exodeoxyribonuclease VII large subunit